MTRIGAYGTAVTLENRFCRNRKFHASTADPMPPFKYSICRSYGLSYFLADRIYGRALDMVVVRLSATDVLWLNGKS